MDVEKIFHMKEGLGESSYAKNSSSQRKALETLRHITTGTISDLCQSLRTQSFRVADLGCSSGPNTFAVVKDMIKALEGKCKENMRPSPELWVFLNDLPTNDFDSIFSDMPDFYNQIKKSADNSLQVYLAVVPGSFYGRLFPSNSLHFVHSSFCLHWLSQVPQILSDELGQQKNKGKMYISETSPTSVIDAYCQQFNRDFILFLKSRSDEVVAGGRMVLILLGRRSRDHRERDSTFFWDKLAQAFAFLVEMKEIEAEKIDSYNVPFYAPCTEEIISTVLREGSFGIDKIETYEMGEEEEPRLKDGRSMAMAVRAIQEALIVHHFGEDVVDRLFEVYGQLLDQELALHKIKVVHLVIVLTRLGINK